MNSLKKIVQHSLLVALVALGVGCATETSIEFETFENESLEAWMDANYGKTEKYEGWRNDPDWRRTDSGVYIYTMRHSEGEPTTDTCWVRINYTGKTLDGNIFYTRNAEVAKIQGTYNRRTHYVDNFVYLYEDNASLPKGMYEAMMGMKVGEMTKVIMPSGMYNGSNGYSETNVGYNGQWGVDGNKPVIIDSLEIVEVSDDPIELENRQVNAYAKSRWNLSEADTLATGLYVQLMTPFPLKRDSVIKAEKSDSTLTCYYKAYFLDGFVFDSNIDSVQMRAWGEVVNEGPMEWDMTKTQMIEGFKEACCQACYGDHIRAIFTSAYGYGISGSAAQAITESSDSDSSDLTDYYNYLNYYSYMNNMYGGGYGGYGSYYNNYYSNYYNPYYYNYYNSSSSSSSDTSVEDEEEDAKVTITTEILPFTPLIFEIWVCADDGSAEDLEHNPL